MMKSSVQVQQQSRPDQPRAAIPDRILDNSHLPAKVSTSSRGTRGASSRRLRTHRYGVLLAGARVISALFDAHRCAKLPLGHSPVVGPHSHAVRRDGAERIPEVVESAMPAGPREAARDERGNGRHMVESGGFDPVIVSWASIAGEHRVVRTAYRLVGVHEIDIVVGHRPVARPANARSDPCRGQTRQDSATVEARPMDRLDAPGRPLSPQAHRS